MSGDVQLWIGGMDARPDPSRLVPVRNRRLGWYKPAPGTAFWTSTWDAERRASGWTDWCDGHQNEHWCDPSCNSWWLLTPDPGARLYVVDDEYDLRRLIRAYGLPTSRVDAHIDFEAMARDFDGLHLTGAGEDATRFTDPGLYGWDCESTCWFRWCFVAVEPAPRPEPALCVTPKSNP